MLSCLQVVRGAGLLYADAVLQINALSPSGGAQLAADAEYFCNVMSALAVAPPAGLITAQLFAAAPADVFGQLADGAVAGGGADVKVGTFGCVCVFCSLQVLIGAVIVWRRIASGFELFLKGTCRSYYVSSSNSAACLRLALPRR
jgi:hypothetical protein